MLQTDLDPQAGHRFEKRVAPSHGRAQAQRAADESDVAMAERGQVLHSLANSLAIIDLEHADIGLGGSGIHKDQRKLAFHELLTISSSMPKVITATPSTLRCSIRRIIVSVRAGS